MNEIDRIVEILSENLDKEELTEIVDFFEDASERAIDKVLDNLRELL